MSFRIQEDSVSPPQSRSTLAAPAQNGNPSETAEATENVATWLQDVARRPWPKAPAGPEIPLTPSAKARVLRSELRHTAILTALTLAFLQYYFIDVNLRIVSLHSVTTFAPAITSHKAAS